MNESSAKELQAENQRLRDLIVSLSATLLRTIAADANNDRRTATSENAERLMHEAEDCFRCATMPGLRKEIAEGLEGAGQEFMTRAVEIETEVQRAKWRK